MPRFGRKAQSEPQYVAGGVDIAVNHQPAGRTGVNTVSKRLGNIRQTPAPGASLRSSIGVNFNQPNTSLFRFVFELGKGTAPCRIAGRLCVNYLCNIAWTSSFHRPPINCHRGSTPYATDCVIRIDRPAFGAFQARHKHWLIR